jgi:energy-coupling factor transporter ATP-binding protein EcfA2
MVFSLLGPNGAGKTTLVRVLATLLAPDRGRAELFGRDVVADADAARELLGRTGQFGAVDEILSGRENLQMFVPIIAELPFSKQDLSDGEGPHGFMSMYCAEVLSLGPGSAQPESGPVPGVARSRRMPDVKVLLIRESLEGFFLERLTESGEVIGNTQHDTLDDAMRHAHSEYDPISNWRLCPDDVDPLEYIRTPPLP